MCDMCVRVCMGVVWDVERGGHTLRSPPFTRPVRHAHPVDPNQTTTLNNGYLGSRIDEERSEMRYVV